MARKSVSTGTISRIKEKYGSFVCFGNEIPETVYVPTGNIGVDTQILGGYGLPQGTIAHLYGWEGSGKSRFAKDWIREIQQQFPDKFVAVLPTESGDYSKEAMEIAGIDPEKLYIINAPTIDISMNALIDLLYDEDKKEPRNEISAWVIDSIAMGVTPAENETEIGDNTVRAPLAALLKHFLPIVNVKQGRAIGIIVNQLRQGQATRPGLPVKDHTPGGKMLPFAAKIELKFYKHEEEKVGKLETEISKSFKIFVKAEKNNTGVGAPFSSCVYKIYTGNDGHIIGLDKMECLINAAVRFGIIQKSGAWLKYKDLPQRNSIAKLVKDLSDDDIARIREEVYAAARNVHAPIVAEDDPELVEIETAASITDKDIENDKN